MTAFQSMGDKEICILVVDEDAVCESIVGRMLQHCCHYEVMKLGRVSGGLSIIREKKDHLQLVLTNVQKSNPNGSKILMQIEREFKLPLLPITPYEKGSSSPSSSSSSSSPLLSQQVEMSSVTKLCFLKSMGMDEFKRVWQHAYTKEKEKEINNNNNNGDLAAEDNGSLSSNQKKRVVEETNNNGSVCSSQKKRAFVEESDQDSTKGESKQRIVWNQWMHLKFVDAINQLGPDRAIPKKIVEVMNIPGLTRENVASHLQKHRMNIKRAEEKARQMNPLSEFHHYNHGGQLSTESSLFQSTLCPPNYSYTQQPLYGLSTQFHNNDNTNNNNNPHAASSFMQVDHQHQHQHHQSGAKNVNEPSGNSYIGFKLTGNGISVETGRQMVCCPVTEMVNELSDEGSIFLQCSADSSSVDDPLLSNNLIQNQQMMNNPVQGMDNDLVLELDNSGVDVDLDDLLTNVEAGDERSLNHSEFLFNDCIFDDILFNN